MMKKRILGKLETANVEMMVCRQMLKRGHGRATSMIVYIDARVRARRKEK